MIPISRRAAFVLVSFLSAATCAVGATSTAAPAVAQPGAVELQVIVPPSWRPMLEDRVSETLSDEIHQVFQQSGFKGELKDIDSDDTSVPHGSRLTVNLLEWRMGFSGNIDCTFTATLQTPRGVKHLGSFSGMALRWMAGPGRFGLSDSFTQAADDAIRQMYDAIAKSKLLDGAATR